MDKRKPLVSIVTIVYNGEKHLEQTIQSVLNQTYSNIEYIIIDGGSKDNTINIIEKYSDRLAYWISEKDNGISDAFNKGIAKSTGEIVGLINADDWCDFDAIKHVVSSIDDRDVAYGDMAYWKNGVQQMIVYGKHSFLNHEMSINHPTVFVKRHCYQQYGLFDTNYKYAMDYDYVLRLEVNNCSFIHVPQILANMRWEGVSDKYWLETCKEALSIKNKYLPDKKFTNWLYFFKQVTAISFGKFLQRIKLSGIVKFYRRFSPIKKKHH